MVAQDHGLLFDVCITLDSRGRLGFLHLISILFPHRYIIFERDVDRRRQSHALQLIKTRKWHLQLPAMHPMG
jgi:hypothetical protein